MELSAGAHDNEITGGGFQQQEHKPVGIGFALGKQTPLSDSRRRVPHEEHEPEEQSPKD